VDEWPIKNSEFFDTDVYFFYTLFKLYPHIQRDVDPFISDDLIILYNVVESYEALSTQVLNI
jgi:hypothetical protein